MGKWVRIMDFRHQPSYRNPKARLVYIHLAMSQDISTGSCLKSTRVLARELGLTHAEVRHALKCLQTDGLIATQVATQSVTQPTTRLATQSTTQITILINNELSAPNGAPNNTPNNTPSNTPSNTAYDTQNNINIKKITPTHAARACVKELCEVGNRFGSMGTEVTEEKAKEFLALQDLKGKTWQDEGDLKAHFVAWLEKHRPPQPPRRISDHEARVAERQRAAEAAAAETPEERRVAELAKLSRWRREAVARKDENQVKMLTEAIKKLQAS